MEGLSSFQEILGILSFFGLLVLFLVVLFFLVNFVLHRDIKKPSLEFILTKEEIKEKGREVPLKNFQVYYSGKEKVVMCPGCGTPQVEIGHLTGKCFTCGMEIVVNSNKMFFLNPLRSS
ncbi:MAG: hypothetical protein ACLFNR_00995 [Candidatus Paceibacterota bacterium]